MDNVTYMKSLGRAFPCITWRCVHEPGNVAKIFQHEFLELILPAIEPLLKDSDRFKQRAGAEMVIGLLRGSSLKVLLYVILNCGARFEALAEAMARPVMGLVHVSDTGHPQ